MFMENWGLFEIHRAVVRSVVVIHWNPKIFILLVLFLLLDSRQLSNFANVVLRLVQVYCRSAWIMRGLHLAEVRRHRIPVRGITTLYSVIPAPLFLSSFLFNLWLLCCFHDMGMSWTNWPVIVLLDLLQKLCLRDRFWEQVSEDVVELAWQ